MFKSIVLPFPLSDCKGLYMLVCFVKNKYFPSQSFVRGFVQYMNIFMTGLTPFLVEEKGVHVLQSFPNRKLNKFLISRMKFIYQKEKIIGLK